jgi:hypothetical protein
MSDDPQAKFQAALATFQDAYADFFDLMADYPATHRDRSGATGYWSPKQVIDHLAGWLAEAESRYRELTVGTLQPKPYNADAFNVMSVEERGEQTWDDTLIEVLTRHDTLMALADSLSADQVALTDGYADWLTDLAEDCRAHTAELSAFAIATGE